MERGIEIVNIIVKKMETDEEKRGKAYVHWKSWQEAYPGMVSQEYLDKLSIDTCVEMAYRYPDNIYVAKDGDTVVGFVAYGKHRGEDLENHGEIYAIYVLSEYYGTGVGEKMMQVGLDELSEYPKVAILVLKEMLAQSISMRSLDLDTTEKKLKMTYFRPKKSE